jgi:beta-lactam-binding protein with PASTA domain
VTVTVSKGSEVIIVPSVLGMLEADAIAKLESVGLEVDVVYVEGADEGTVSRQLPIPNSSAKRGDVVMIEVGRTVVP